MTNVSELCEAWLVAKSVEEDARNERVAIEEKMLDAIGRPNGESSSTKDYNGFKITVSPSVTRKLDVEKAQNALLGIPENLRPVKVVADETGLKYLFNSEPEMYRGLSPYIETRVGKVGVKVVRKS